MWPALPIRSAGSDFCHGRESISLTRGHARASATSPAFLPKLKELAQVAEGDFRLHWHGAIRPSRVYGVHGHKIDALFIGLDDPRITHTITLPLGTFPHLAVGTIWKDGVFDGHDVLDTKTVEISVPGRDQPRWRPCRLSDVLPEKFYPTHNLATPAGCFLLTTAAGEELIVPYAEILRAWYFFDSQVIPAVLGGAITLPYVLPLKYLPWVPELSGEGDNGSVRIVHKNRLSISSAQCLARLIFDDVARKRTVSISKQIRSRLQDPSIPLPLILPPFYGPASWDVRCYPVENTQSQAPRFMVQQLLGSNDKLPYNRLERLPLNDLRPGSTMADDLQEILRNTTRNIFEDSNDIELTGLGPDNSLQAVSVIGLSFGNSALKVHTVIPAKDEQTHTGKWIKDEDAIIKDASVDPTADPAPGTPSSSQETGSGTDEVELVHTIDIAEIFGEIVCAVASHPSLRGMNWRGDFPFDRRKVVIKHPTEDTARSFIIARVSNGLRNLYLMDAEPINNEKTGRLIAFEIKSGDTLSLSQLNRWLSSFPSRPGCRWTNTESMRMQLAFERMNHQKNNGGAEDHTRSLFRDRVVNRLLGMILD